MNAMTPIRANGFGKLIDPDHKSVARDLGYVLTLGDEAAWGGFSTVCKARLTDTENAAAAVAHLRALNTDQRALIFDAFQPVKSDPLDCAAFREAVAEYRQARGRAA